MGEEGGESEDLAKGLPFFSSGVQVQEGLARQGGSASLSVSPGIGVRTLSLLPGAMGQNHKRECG